MKQYIKYLVIACGLPIVIATIMIVGIWWLFTKTVNLHVDDAKHIAVFGNSMGECSINDTILSDFQNCCCSGMYYTMEKGVAISFLKQNPQVDTVFFVFRGIYVCNFKKQSRYT